MVGLALVGVSVVGTIVAMVLHHLDDRPDPAKVK